MDNQINIGIFGLGTVSTGVLAIIDQNKELLQKRSGSKINIKKIVVSNLNKKRSANLSGIQMSDDPAFILKDEEIHIIIELIGDIRHSEKIIVNALESRKSVITANKAVLARKSISIFNAAYKSNSFLGFEASVGSGIPVIRSIREGFSGDNILSFQGIVNSTSNYILTKMSETGHSFSEALHDAQDKGFAEPDSEFDVNGLDGAHKLIVLMNLSYNKYFPYEDLYIEGISHISTLDIKYSHSLGYKIKHICWSKNIEGKFHGAVHPLLFKEDEQLSKIEYAYNGIQINTEFGGPFMFSGLGAGAKEAASAIISDLVEAIRNKNNKQAKNVFPLSIESEQLKECSIESFKFQKFSYYLRIDVTNNEQSIKGIKQIFTKNKISIDYFKKEKCSWNGRKRINLVYITKIHSENVIQKTINEIKKIDLKSDDIILLRINKT